MLSQSSLSRAALLTVVGLASISLPASSESGSVMREIVSAPVTHSCSIIVQGTSTELGGCWFLSCAAEEPSDLGCGLAAMHDVVELLPSPDRAWIAVVSVGEGHPVLEVVDLQALLAGGSYRSCKTIDPYPGTITVSRWTAESLLVASDMPLSRLPIRPGGGDRYLFKAPRLFELNVHTWRVREAERRRNTEGPTPNPSLQRTAPVVAHAKLLRFSAAQRRAGVTLRAEHASRHRLGVPAVGCGR